MSEPRRATAIALLLSTVFLAGCRRQLVPEEFIRSYEETAAVTVERNGIKMVILYQSPDFLAAVQGGSGAKAATLDSLKAEYGKAHYYRVSFRPALASTDRDPAAAAALPTAIPALQAERGRQLMTVRGELSRRIRLEGEDGATVEPISASLQQGLAGASNTILVVFPRTSRGQSLDPGKYDLVIEDLGLNFGTLRRKLAPPKGIRLKVAA